MAQGDGKTQGEFEAGLRVHGVSAINACHEASTIGLGRAHLLTQRDRPGRSQPWLGWGQGDDVHAYAPRSLGRCPPGTGGMEKLVPTFGV